jgi:hypothetical protein
MPQSTLLPTPASRTLLGCRFSTRRRTTRIT